MLKHPAEGKGIVIVAINQTTAKYLPASLREAGYEPVFLLDVHDKYEGASRESLATCQTAVVDLKSPESVRQVLKANPHLLAEAGAMTTFYDDMFPLVGNLAREFGLRSPECAIARLSEKSELQRTLPEFSPESLFFTRETLEAQDFSSLAHAQEWILKPSRSNGAAGIEILKRGPDLKQAVRSALARTPLRDAATQTWILQERIPGRLISLEGFVQAGQLHILGFSLRTRIELTEVADEFPVDDLILAPARARCLEALNTLVRRAQFQNGYFHCEFIAQAATSFLIDGNIGRLGGSAILEMLATSYGIDAKDIIRHVTLLPLYPDAAVSPFRSGPGPLPKTLDITYGLPRATILKSIQFPTASVCRHTQVAGMDSKVPRIGVSDESWVGTISGLKEDVIREIEQIVVHTSEGPMKPVYALQE